MALIPSLSNVRNKMKDVGMPNSSTPSLVNPRRACARVTVVVLFVCLSVCLSVPTLAASASVETSNQRYSRVSLRLFLD